MGVSLESWAVVIWQSQREGLFLQVEKEHHMHCRGCDWFWIYMHTILSKLSVIWPGITLVIRKNIPLPLSKELSLPLHGSKQMFLDYVGLGKWNKGMSLLLWLHGALCHWFLTLPLGYSTLGRLSGPLHWPQAGHAPIHSSMPPTSSFFPL